MLELTKAYEFGLQFLDTAGIESKLLEWDSAKSTFVMTRVPVPNSIIVTINAVDVNVPCAQVEYNRLIAPTDAEMMPKTDLWRFLELITGQAGYEMQREGHDKHEWSLHLQKSKPRISLHDYFRDARNLGAIHRVASLYLFQE